LIAELSIENYALIDHLKIDFSGGFSVITGETGSGKSILLGALALILGERADSNSIRDKSKKCIIEGVFTVNKLDIKPWFELNDIDFEEQTILRREINTQGKSRAFINDTPVGLNILKQLSESLIDIHSQHETRLLNDQHFVFDIIDSQIKTPQLILDYKKDFLTYKSDGKNLVVLQEEEAQSQNEKDYLTFLMEELNEIDLNKILSSDIEAEYHLISNAEEIQQLIRHSEELLTEGRTSSLNSLKEVQSQLQRLASISDKFSPLAERLNSSIIELDDLANELSQSGEEDSFDPQRLSILEEQISILNRLVKKHNVTDYAELLSKKEEISAKIKGIGSISKRITVLQKQISTQEVQLNKTAAQISRERAAVIPNLEKDGKALLSKMSMPNAHFKFDLKHTDTLTQFGNDEITLMAKTNLGSDFAPLKKIASGGESSRIMLAIKSLQSQNKSLPTIIFDEIDTGVSGEVAENMGLIMKELGEKMQVLSITHLPQIASKGSQHYKVYKEDKNNLTTTSMIQLTSEDRIKEIANMLSGSKVTEAAMDNAKELLKL
jgi:DNA repair protein RecN (Recombination protein N)